MSTMDEPHGLFDAQQTVPGFASHLATDAYNSRGRVYDERESASRSMLQRDRDRIIHSGAFRRLQFKTQVFVYHEGDHYRSRLTHSIEVAQIARSIARTMGVNEDLAEALALAHDLGHTPFGHAGEAALDREMEKFGGFDHNAQSLRIVTKLEQRYAAFDGLNLTWETLEGLVKHNGPVVGELAPLKYQDHLPAVLEEYCETHDLELGTYASLEAQIAALSDDIAYNNHDIDDGLRAGLFQIEDLMDLPLVGPVFRDVRQEFPELSKQRLIHESIRRLISIMVLDIVEETRRRVDLWKPATVDDVRKLGKPLASFSSQMQSNDKAVKAFLRQNMYRHFKVNRAMSKAKRVVSDLFNLYMEEPEILAPEWQGLIQGKPIDKKARVISDFIAGMTDRFALQEHRRMFDLTVSELK